MTNKLALSVLLMCIGSAASAQQKSMETMDGECQPNSQFTRTTEAELKQRASKQKLFSCSGALVVEYNNGRVVVVFTPKDKNGLSVAYAGTYGGASASARNYLETDGIYLYGQEFDQSRKESNGHCEIERSRGKVNSIACLAVTPLKAGAVIVSSAVFKPTSYSIENGDKPAPAQPKPAPSPSQPQREPWYGVSADGNRCVPTDMSPAERIEWLRKQGIRYDAIDRDGMTVNGRPPKVTIIPKGSNYRSWVYYASQSTCEEAETRIDKYR